MASIGELVIQLKAETATFAADLAKAGNITTTSVKHMQAGFAQVSTTVAGMGASFAQMAAQASGSSSIATQAILTLATSVAGHAGDIRGWMNKIALSVLAVEVAMAAAAVAFLQSGVEMAASLGHAAEKSGTTAAEFSALAFAAKQSHTDTETLSMGLARLAKNASLAADGSKMQAQAFERLGVTVTDSSGRLRPMTDLLLDMAAKFKAMPDSTEKTALAMQAFGRAGMQMIPFLNLGREGIARFIEEAKKAGIVLTEEMARGAIEAEQAFNLLAARSTAFKLALTSDLLPAVKAITDALEQMNRSGAGVTVLATVFKGLAFAIAANVTFVQQLFFAVKLLADGMMLLQAATALSMKGMETWRSQIAKDYEEIQRLRSAFHEFADELFATPTAAGVVGGAIVPKISGVPPDVKSFLDKLPVDKLKELAAEAARSGQSITEFAHQMMAAGGIVHDAAEKLDKLEKALQAVTLKLREQIETAAKSAAAVELWRLKQLGASEAVLAHIKNLQAYALAVEAAHAPLSKMVKLTDDMTEAIKRQAAEEKARRAAATAAETQGLLEGAGAGFSIADVPGIRAAATALRDFNAQLKDKGDAMAYAGAIEGMRNDLAWLAQELTRDAMPAHEKFRIGLQQLNFMFDQGMISARTYGVEVLKLKDYYGVVASGLDVLRVGVRTLEADFSSLFEGAISGAQSFHQALKKLLEDFLQLLLFGKEGTGGLLGGWLSSLGGGGGFWGSLFGGGKAGGGSAEAGRAYVVGERGPELFVPSISGTVLRTQEMKRLLSGLPVTGLAAGGAAFAGVPYIGGESGPELFVPDFGGASSASSRRADSTTIIINAQGADAGVEHRITRALAALHDRTIKDGLAAAKEAMLRR